MANGAFAKFPKALFSNEVYDTNLSNDSKLLYMLMRDRMCLSERNGWTDERGRVFIIFSVEEIMRELHIGNKKVQKLLGELEGIGLIERKRRGLGLANRIFVNELTDISEEHITECHAETAEDAAETLPEISEGHGINTYPNNTYPNNTEENNTELIKTDIKSSVYSPSFHIISENKNDMNERKRYRELIKDNIEYDIIASDSHENTELLPEIVELIVDGICTTAPYIRVAQDNKPTEVVRKQFLSLNADHIRFVLDSLGENTNKVRNMRNYLTTALYNAPFTMRSYYKNRVNHDMVT